MTENVYDDPIEFFQEVAERVYRQESLAEGRADGQFIVRERFNRYVYAGWGEGDDKFTVAKIQRSTETINRNEPRLKTSENTYARCELYRMDITVTGTDSLAETIDAVIENRVYDEKIDTGYIHGYRVTPLSTVLKDVFKWY